MDYAIFDKPQNVFGDALEASQAASYACGVHDVICFSDETCANTSYESWLERKYPITPAIAQIRSADRHRLDLAGGSGAPGTAVQVAVCNGNTSQRFAFQWSTGEIRARNGSCVTTQHRPSGAVVLPCTGLRSQKWTYDEPAGELQDAIGYCLTQVPSATGPTLAVRPCDSAASQQKWSMTAGFELRGLAGKCLDVEGATSADGTPVQLFSCAGAPSQQQWRRGPNNSILGLEGKCLAVQGRSGSTELRSRSGTATALPRSSGSSADGSRAIVDGTRCPVLGRRVFCEPRRRRRRSGCTLAAGLRG